MIDVLLRMLAGATVGLALVLLLRRPARHVFGAGSAFALWLLPIALAFAPLLPERLVPTAMVVLPGLTVTPHAGAAMSSPVIGIDWAIWLLVAWTIGTAAGLLRLGVHYFRLLRGLRRAPAAWTNMLAKAAPNFDHRRVRVHDAGPAVLWSLPRSLILLPADFAERFDNAATRELVLRHELTHARRGDALWNLAMEIAFALLWFHPLAWIARPRFRLDLELACDAASLRALPERAAVYARALLHSVAVQPAPTLIPWLSQPQLKERIAMITRIPPGVLRRRAGFAAIAMLLAAGLYVAGGRVPVAAATQTRSTPIPPTVDITYKNQNPPHYPVEALHKGEEGQVILDITVDAMGNPTDVRIDQRGTNASALLQLAAITAARKWKFNPGRENGKAVGGTIQVPINFSLEGFDEKSAAIEPCPTGAVYDTALSKCVKLKPQPASS